MFSNSWYVFTRCVYTSRVYMSWISDYDVNKLTVFRVWDPWLSNLQGAETVLSNLHCVKSLAVRSTGCGSLTLSNVQDEEFRAVKFTGCGIPGCQIYMVWDPWLLNLHGVESLAAKSTWCGILGCQICRVWNPCLSNLQGVKFLAVKFTGCRICVC